MAVVNNGYTPLPKPVPVSEQRWPEGTHPLVSFLCITYNHRPFIEECLKGFLIQETTFPVEIIVRDDASTDGTQDVIQIFEEKYPNLIHAVYEKENTFSRGVRPLPRALELAKGEFVAVCEGDDYWTCPSKIEEQTCFLVKRPHVGMHAQNALVHLASQELPFSRRKAGPVSLRDLAVSRQFATASICARRKIWLEFDHRYFLFGDTPLTIHFAVHSTVFYEDKITSVYRRHPQGMTASISGNLQMARKQEDYTWRLFKLCGNRFKRVFSYRIAEVYWNLADYFNASGKIWAAKICRRKALRECFTYPVQAWLLKLSARVKRKISGQSAFMKQS